MESIKGEKKNLGILSLTALGIVFGDIGTSPLYAVRECFYGGFGVEPNTANIMGAISLIFWALIIVISLKYLILILRADNKGEGGILALMHLVLPKNKRSKNYMLMSAMGLFGAALLYGDGMITPAISVLSAIEGLSIATTVFDSFVIPITIGILIGLFLFQKKGTHKVGFVFGPLILIWFIILAVLGFNSIVKHPEILKALNPYFAFQFFVIHHWHGIFILGAIFLVVTGGEALYADIGHFGKKPIRIAWFAVVLPALVINYLGQGALLLGDPSLAINPFYHLAPQWAIYPLVIMAAMATVIASQAVISGAFSLTFQAIQLGYFPRVNVIHTSGKERGQIYIPQINWILFLGTISLVFSFKTSANLASAYGVAVSTTMVITTLLAFHAMRDLWKWKLSTSIIVTLLLLFIDLSFLMANLSKIPEGGWFPLLLAGGIYLLMTTWHKGRRIVMLQFRKLTGLLSHLLETYNKNPSARIKGTAFYFVSNNEYAPPALLMNLKHNKVLHEQVIILSVIFHTMAHISIDERLELTELGNGFYLVNINYGFMDNKDIPEALDLIRENGISLNEDDITYILGRETFITDGKKGMAEWRELIFAFLSRNSLRATKYFNLPSNQVLEIGSQLEI
jgi:KUP system potassium uptake protein